MTTSATDLAIDHYISAISRTYRPRAPIWATKRALRMRASAERISIQPFGSDLSAEVVEDAPGTFVDAVARGSVGLLSSYAKGKWRTDDLYGVMQALLDFESRFLVHRGWLPRPRASKERHENSQISLHYDLPWEMFSDTIVANSYSATRLRFDTESGSSAYASHHRDIINKLLPGGGHLLDLGCGWGGLIDTALRTERNEITAVTLSPIQADSVRLRLNDEIARTRLRVIEGDFTNLGLLPAEADAITMIESIEHLGMPQRAEFFARLSRRYPHASLAVQSTTRSGAAAHRRMHERGALVELIFPGPGSLPTARVLRKELSSAGYEIEATIDMTSEYVSTALGWMRGFTNLAANEANLAPIARLFEAYAAATAASLDRGLVRSLLFICRPTALP